MDYKELNLIIKNSFKEDYINNNVLLGTETEDLINNYLISIYKSHNICYKSILLNLLKNKIYKKIKLTIDDSFSYKLKTFNCNNLLKYINNNVSTLDIKDLNYLQPSYISSSVKYLFYRINNNKKFKLSNLSNNIKYLNIFESYKKINNIENNIKKIPYKITKINIYDSHEIRNKNNLIFSFIKKDKVLIRLSQNFEKHNIMIKLKKIALFYRKYYDNLNKYNKIDKNFSFTFIFEGYNITYTFNSYFSFRKNLMCYLQKKPKERFEHSNSLCNCCNCCNCLSIYY